MDGKESRLSQMRRIIRNSDPKAASASAVSCALNMMTVQITIAASEARTSQARKAVAPSYFQTSQIGGRDLLFKRFD
jgi:hypothetical protein